MSNELLFGIAIVLLLLVFAYTVFGKHGQSDISKHPGGTESQAPGAERDSRIGTAATGDPGDQSALGQHGTK